MKSNHQINYQNSLLDNYMSNNLITSNYIFTQFILAKSTNIIFVWFFLTNYFKCVDMWYKYVHINYISQKVQTPVFFSFS
jgi:hypothetical protein